jgi:photosystem II stability/assembly factor-like uncharacterized protein
MSASKFAVYALLLLLFSSAPAEANWWKVQTSGIDTNLRAVSAVYVPDAKANGAPVPVVWASGSNGVILKSVDEGKNWTRLHVTEGDSLDFRGIVAFSASTAYVMSIGDGEKSRIYKTIDGGQTWALQYTDKRKEFFLDAIACLSETHCLALGDPIDGKFLLLKTTDGAQWQPLPSDNMPAALPAEGAFAASNSSLLLSGENIFFGTGGPAARVFRSTDSGCTWTVAETPIAHGNTSSGIFSIVRWRGRDRDVVVVGGDYQAPGRASAVAAHSLDDGQTWQLSTEQPGGFRSGVVSNSLSVFAIGPNGQDFSEDEGIRWKHTDSLNLNAAVLLDIFNGWAVGSNGTIARFVNHKAAEIHYRRPRSKQSSPASAIAD